MAYFPLFVDLKGKRCLVVGGKRVALRKARALAEYGGEVFAVAEVFCEGWEGWKGVKEPVLIRRRAVLADADGMDLVICAASDAVFHREMSRYCRERAILVNVADSKEESSFLFPALVRRKDVVLGISTGGNSPAASRYLREEIERRLPENFGALVEKLGSFRELVKEALPKQKEREKVFSRIFFSALEEGEVNEEMVRTLIQDYARMNTGDNG